ncbi:MAG: acetyl-CoA hydrolase/transferase family protein [Bacteroidales bacterium]|nr:acetyl-CoA hydrolase/transferase family protein [Bacteroidales bacterium]
MKKSYQPVSAQEAVKVIKSGDHIHISCVAAAPQSLIKAMCDRGRNHEFENVYIHHLHTEGPAPYAEPEFEGIFHHDAFFVGKNVRPAVQSGLADYIPVNLSEIPSFYRMGYLPCDVLLVMVSEPDENGYVSLGTSVADTLGAMDVAKCVIAEVNPNMPRCFGDAMIPMSRINVFVENDEPLYPAHMAPIDEISKQIGKNCAALIDDGACIQMGIGTIPNAILAELGNHKDLGVHTEMFSDGVLPLVEKGVINGRNKKLDTGKMVSTFLMGSQKLYSFLNNNPDVLMKECSYTNDPFIVAQQPKMTAINSGIEIDLTGQVCADSIGTKVFSGCGGQIDFVYGASRAPQGKAIMAMPSATNKGVSKIVPTLKTGAGVVTTRFHIHHFVTEYGAVDLYGKSMQQRAKLLISVAHPDHREELERAAVERWGTGFLNVKI